MICCARWIAITPRLFLALVAMGQVTALLAGERSAVQFAIPYHFDQTENRPELFARSFAVTSPFEVAAGSDVDFADISIPTFADEEELPSLGNDRERPTSIDTGELGAPTSVLPGPDSHDPILSPPQDLMLVDEPSAADTKLAEPVLTADELLSARPGLAPSLLTLPPRIESAGRFGWWFVESKGNPVKIGEYQSLRSAPFADFDGLHSDGITTLDYSTSIFDHDASRSRVRLIGPRFSSRVDYQRYLRRVDRDPLDFFVDFDQQPPLPLPAAPANFRDMKEDLIVGDDLAIRVQELDTSFQGKLSENVKWRLNLWGMRKHGERQAIAMAHCFNATNATDTNGNPVAGRACHMLSQSQRIDWLTAEIEPVIEGTFGPVTAEYSRVMRSLSTDDQLVTRPYDNFGFAGNQPYAIVPENTTAIDRVKIGVNLPNQRDAYARVYHGNTENEFRDTNRRFHGLDLRITDRSVEGITVTGYAKKYVQSGQIPTVLLPFETVANVRAPINYDRTTAGLQTTWRPFLETYDLRSRLILNSGYEYRDIERENATFVEDVLTSTQAATTTNQLQTGATLNWTTSYSTYVRYRLSFIDDPLYGVPIRNTTTNSSLPTQVHHVEFGNSWAPAQTFMLTGLVGMNYGWNDSEIANFQEDNLDLAFTAWYAPVPRWSFSGGLAFYSNWIDQDITLGSKTNPLTLPWEYTGRSDVVNFGTTFAWTERVTLSSTIDFVRGRNAFDALVPWPNLNGMSDVNVETMRLSFGTDVALFEQANWYTRFQLFDFDDRSGTLEGGTAEMFLIGATAYF